MGKYIRGNIDEGLQLGTLAAKDLVLIQFGEVVNERTLVSSIVAAVSVVGITPEAGVGPVLVGIAHGDYTAAEIEEFIETTDSWDEGNLVEQETAGRKIRRLGILRTPDSATESSRLADGRQMKTKLNWILTQGQTLSLWAYNMGAAPFSTTDPRIDLQGHANLWPR